MTDVTIRRRARRESPLVRRKDLLDATVTCLARLGPRGTTGREICRQAGVSHGLLRHYFRNPDNLLFETYEQLCDDLLAHVELAVAPVADDPWAALHAFFVAVFSDDWASPDIIGAWIVFWQQVRSRDDFAAVSDAFNLRQRALLERIVHRLPQQAGALPIADAVAILSAVLDGLWIEFYLSDRRTPHDRCIALCDQAARRLFTA
ncbi:TetR family transcriptional regulator C-terminal domain-containing protein [Novosphingobium sp.]|uniref:TetR family transcriptional regulator C-terminal domain-containing protein n=1 Tax=Novosphingobium sp. TaxID=1874826 RepID=UPI00333EC2AA